MKFRASTSAPARLQRASGVQPASVAVSRPLWLVGAELCVFTEIDLRAVPARHRGRAIADRARQLSPFGSPAWHAADAAGSVALWIWDAARVTAAIAAEDGPSRRWQILPEQLFLTPALDACLREIDGTQRLLERWRAGRLVFSCTLPDAQPEAALRLRSAGLAPDALPPAVRAALQPVRWDLPPFDWRVALRDPLVAAGLALACAVLWLVWSLGELAGERAANTRLDASVESRERELAPLLEERSQALALVARNQALAGLLSGRNALEAAAEFEHLVGARYQRLLQWEVNARSARAMVEDKAADNRAYVEALQQSPWFERVAVAPTLRPEQVSLEITLSANPKAAPLYLTAGRTP